MSGGSYSYLYQKLDDMVEEMELKNQEEYLDDRHTTIYAMKEVSKLAKSIEWADSGDSGTEELRSALDEFFIKMNRISNIHKTNKALDVLNDDTEFNKRIEEWVKELKGEE
jgi:hypothetical protein